MCDPCCMLTLVRMTHGILPLWRFSTGPHVGESPDLDEPIPDVEKVFREMLAKGIRPTRITIRVVEKVLGRRVVKRVLEELNVDEILLGDLSAADFQRRRALVAPRAQECERHKRRSYLKPTQTLAAADPARNAHCLWAVCGFALPTSTAPSGDSGPREREITTAHLSKKQSECNTLQNLGC